MGAELTEINQSPLPGILIAERLGMTVANAHDLAASASESAAPVHPEVFRGSLGKSSKPRTHRDGVESRRPNRPPLLPLRKPSSSFCWWLRRVRLRAGEI